MLIYCKMNREYPILPSKPPPASRPLPGKVRVPALSSVAAEMRVSRSKGNRKMRKSLAPDIYNEDVPPLMNAEELERHESAIRDYMASNKKDIKKAKDDCRKVIFENYYKNKKMVVRDTSTVQEQDKSMRVEMGAK